ncbi:hypothetical protein pb186bvf_014638 [Paramecium bursaria]
MNLNQMNHLMQKLYIIDKGLGGDAIKKKNAKGNQYDMIREMLVQKMHQIAKKQDERDLKLQKYGNDRDLIALGYQIRESISEADSYLKEMQKSLDKMSKNKKYTQEEIQLRTKLLQKYQENIDNIKDRESGDKDDQIIVDDQTNDVKEYQRRLFEDKNRNVVYELTKEDEQALARFREMDLKIDDELDKVIAGADGLKQTALQIGQKIDDIQPRIKNITHEVDKTNESLMNSNKRLKQLLLKFRQPNKFCLDLTLFLLLLI